jgi:hypothetical protein
MIHGTPGQVRVGSHMIARDRTGSRVTGTYGFLAIVIG